LGVVTITIIRAHKTTGKNIK